MEEDTSGTGRTKWIALALGVLALVAVAVALSVRSSEDDEPRRDRPRQTVPAPAVDPIVTGDYAWRPLAIGGGGFVTGIVAGTRDGAPVLYARTDVGGAYRWDADAGIWQQLLLAGSLADDYLTSSDYSVASIATAPSDPNVVVVAVGNDDNRSDSETGPPEGRVLWSTDSGQTWTSGPQRWRFSGNQGHRTAREQLAIDPQDPRRAFFGTQRDGLWQTDDAGATWSRVPDDQVPDGVSDAPDQDQTGVSSVSWVPTDTGGAAVIVVGVTGDGVYASADGTTWRQVVELADADIPSSATQAGDDLVVSTATTDGSPARLIRLTDVSAGDVAAIGVEEITPPSTASIWIIAAAPDDPTRMALTDDAVRDGHFWTSADGGASWTSHEIAIDAPATPWLEATDLDSYMSSGRLLFDPIDSGRLWFAEGMGVWRTDDPTAAEVVWTSETLGIEEVVVSDIVVPPGGSPLVTVADRQGFLFPGTDQLPDRTLIDERFASGTSIDVSGGHPERLAWVGAQSNLDPFSAEPRGATSADGGLTWTEMRSMEPEMYGGEVAVSATDPDTIVWLPSQRGGAAAGGLFVSGNGGSSWDQVALDDESFVLERNFWWFGRRSLAADRVGPEFYLLGNDERVRASSDGGRTWTPTRHAPPCSVSTDCHVFGQLQAEPERAGHLWASTGTAGLHRTTDAGETRWLRVGSFAETRAFGFGAPVGESSEPAVYVHATPEAGGRFGIWRSTDGGRHWKLLTEDPGGLGAQVNVVAGDPDVPGRVYVGFAGNGVVYGDDTTLGDG